MKALLLVVISSIILSSVSQGQTFASLDKSPMDKAYFPNNFAHDRKGADEAVIRVTYSRPQKSGREVFGKLVPWKKVWRAGANEATEIKFYKDVEIGGKKVKAGTYSLFAIPDEKEWTIILNSDMDYWGAYSYKEGSDVVRFMATPMTNATPVENFTIQFKSTGTKQGVMQFAWDTTVAEAPFSY